MLAPLLFVWPISIAVTHYFANIVAAYPYDQALHENVNAIARQIKFVDGKPVEGTWRAHQVPVTDLQKPEHLKILEECRAEFGIQVEEQVFELLTRLAYKLNLRRESLDRRNIGLREILDDVDIAAIKAHTFDGKNWEQSMAGRVPWK